MVVVVVVVLVMAVACMTLYVALVVTPATTFNWRRALPGISPGLVLGADPRVQLLQFVVLGRPPRAGRQRLLVVGVRQPVANAGDSLHPSRLPLVELDRLYDRDVGTQAPVCAAAPEAHQQAEVHGGPLRTAGIAICTHVVPRSL